MAKKLEMTEAAIEKQILANLHKIIQSGRTQFSREELLRGLRRASVHQVDNVLKILSGSVIARPNHAGRSKVQPLHRLLPDWSAEAIQSLRDFPPLPAGTVLRERVDRPSIFNIWGVFRARRRK